MHQLLAVQDGVITRTQMRAAGCSASALARLVAREVLIRMHAGVYRHAAAALTPALKLRPPCSPRVAERRSPTAPRSKAGACTATERS